MKKAFGILVLALLLIATMLSSIRIPIVSAATLSVAVSPSTVTLSVDQPQNFSCTASGGGTPYSYGWGNGTLITQAVIDVVRSWGLRNQSTWTFIWKRVGTYFVVATVENSTRGSASAIASVTVRPRALTTVVVTSNPLWTDTGWNVASGDTVHITASGNWTVDFYTPSITPWVGPDGLGQAWNDTFLGGKYLKYWGALIAFVGPDPYQGHWGDSSFFPQATGYWEIGSNGSFISGKNGWLWLGFNDDAQSKNIGDNAGNVTANISISVPPPLSVSISPLSASISIGQSVYFTSTVSGGVAPYTYQWYVNGLIAETGPWNYTLKPASTGIYDVYLNVTDSVGSHVTSAIATVDVLPVVSVGGSSVPVDRLGLLAPYIDLISTLAVVAVASALCIDRFKRKKEKQ